MLSGACTGPDIGPVRAFRGVFACMGPAGGPVRALAIRCGYRANLICTGNRSQNGARAPPLPPEFPHELFPIDNEPDMGSLCDAAGLVLGRDLKGEFLAIDLG